MGEEKEDLIRYSRTILEKEKIDYFIYGHRHLAMTFKMKEGPEIVFLGDWITNSSFTEWDGNNIILRMLS